MPARSVPWSPADWFSSGGTGSPRSTSTPGVERWRFETAGAVLSAPAIAVGTLFVGDDQGTLYAVDAARGEQRWRFNAGYEKHSSPTVVDGQVFFASDRGALYVLDAHTGEMIWTVETGFHDGTSPAVAGDKVYVVGTLWSGDILENEVVGALSVYESEGGLLRSRGDLLRSAESTGLFRFAPVPVDGNIYLVTSLVDRLEAWNPEPESDRDLTNWRFPMDAPPSAPAAAAGTVYVSGGDRLYALGAQGGEEL